mgnify:CR=1 FL=1
MTDAEVLQRKDVWSKKEVTEYFGISDKTFERWKKDGEIKAKRIGGKDYCRLIDLKDRLRDRGEDLSNRYMLHAFLYYLTEYFNRLKRKY